MGLLSSVLVVCQRGQHRVCLDKRSHLHLALSRSQSDRESVRPNQRLCLRESAGGSLRERPVHVPACILVFLRHLEVHPSGPFQPPTDVLRPDTPVRCRRSAVVRVVILGGVRCVSHAVLPAVREHTAGLRQPAPNRSDALRHDADEVRCLPAECSIAVPRSDYVQPVYPCGGLRVHEHVPEHHRRELSACP